MKKKEYVDPIIEVIKFKFDTIMGQLRLSVPEIIDDEDYGDDFD